MTVSACIDRVDKARRNVVLCGYIRLLLSTCFRHIDVMRRGFLQWVTIRMENEASY